MNVANKDLNPNDFANFDDDEGGRGDQSGSIEFKDWMTTPNHRDDLLPAAEKDRLKQVHKSGHKDLVTKQKEAIERIKALKEGKVSLQTYRDERHGNQNPYKAHPLSYQAQFSGIDNKVKNLPNELEAETNQEKQQELQYQHRQRYQPEIQPRFIPPKLTPR